MKHLVVGMGSMGKRRVRCLKALGQEDITGFDPREDRRREAESLYGIKTVASLDGELVKSVDALVISTPPDRHDEYLELAVSNGRPAFVEASVRAARLPAISRAAQAAGVVIAPSCTLRFHPAVRDITSIVRSGAYGKVTSFSYHSGQYLPDWHPWESVRDFYVSKKETGACREIVPFELTWLVEVIGFPERISGFFGKTMDVGADIDDTYAVAIQCPGVFGTLVVDVVARHAVRSLRLNLEQGQILWSWDEPQVKLFEARNGRWIVYQQRQGAAQAGYNKNIAEDMYVDEIRAYLRAVEGLEPFPNTLEDDVRILGLLQQIESFHREKELVHGL